MKATGFSSFAWKRLGPAFIGVLGTLGAGPGNLWANNIAYRETIYNTDFASAGVGGMRDASRATINLRGISGTVNLAYLYWHGPMNSTDPMANATIRLNGTAITGLSIGLSDDNCWGFDNSQAYRADVTSLVRATRNGAYVLTQFVKQGTNINANGASLLVFFDDNHPANNRDVVIFDGNDSNAPNPYDVLGWNVTLSGINYSTGRGYLQLHVSDGQLYRDDSVILNGQVLQRAGNDFQGHTVPSANSGPMGFGNLWDIKTWEITSFFTPGTNTLSLTHGYIGRDCISLVVAAINLPAGAAPPPGNRPPVVIGTPQVTVHTPNPIVLEAEATDADGNPLTYTISSDETQVQFGSIPAGSPTTAGTLRLTNAFSLGQHTVLFTANDGQASGNFTTLLNVIDNTPPLLNLPPDITVGTDPGKNTAVVSYIVTATDDFPGVTVTSQPPSGNAFPIGTTTVTAIALDTSSNRTEGTFKITVTNNLPSALQCPPDILRSTDPGSSNAVVHYTIPAVTNVPGTTVSCLPAADSFFPIGITMVVCTATDSANHTTTCTFTVTIVDTEPPVITTPTNLIVVTDLGQCAAVVNFEVTLHDNSPGATLVCTPPSGSTFSNGITTVVCVASDVAGNKTTNAFTVTVVDQEKPVLHLPDNISVPAESGKNSAVVTFNVTATDNCPAVSVVCTPPSGSTFPVGNSGVNCQATDAANNLAGGSFTVTVVGAEPPVIITPTNLIVVADLGQCSAVVNYTVTLRDNPPGATLVCTPPSGSTFSNGITTVVCIASDVAGNRTTNAFTVTVVDQEKPLLHLPANISVTISSNQTSAVVTYNVTATDNCTPVTVVCAPPSGSSFPVGTTTVNCTATDGGHNVTTGSFTVTVSKGGTGDTEPPTMISLTPSPSTLWPPNHKMVSVTLAVKTTDNSGRPVTCHITSVTSNEPENGLGDGDTAPDWIITGALKVSLRAERSGRGNGRVYTITVECKDAAGNVSHGATTVTVPHQGPKKARTVASRLAR